MATITYSKNKAYFPCGNFRRYNIFDIIITGFGISQAPAENCPPFSPQKLKNSLKAFCVTKIAIDFVSTFSDNEWGNKLYQVNSCTRMISLSSYSPTTSQFCWNAKTCKLISFSLNIFDIWNSEEAFKLIVQVFMK